MKIQEIQRILDAALVTKGNFDDLEVHSACGADLMSDVLAFVKDQALLLTGLVNPQVVRTAEMMDVKAIVFVRGKTPTDEVRALAEERGVALLTTRHPLYIACGLLYSAGLGNI
jgi:hypothetical protein